MVEGLANVGHVLEMNNFFSSIGLFIVLLSLDIYATGMIEMNRVGLPMDLKDTKSFKNFEQRFMQWRMYDNQQISCVM